MIIKLISCNLFNLLALARREGIVKIGLSSIIKFRLSNLELMFAIFLKSSFDNSALRILSPEIFDCSANILVANCSEDISREKKTTFPPSVSIFSPSVFSISLNLSAALKAIFVPRAVLPIEGLPATIIKSEL